MDTSKIKITYSTQRYLDNPNAKWVAATYIEGRNTFIVGRAIDKYDSEELAIEAAKSALISKVIKREQGN